MATTGVQARRAAVTLLEAVLADKRLLSEVLADRRGPLAALDPADRARAQRLALTVLRHIDRADAVLKPHLRKSPPPFVRNILRLATVEMLAEGAAPHGAVNAAVEMLRRGRKTETYAGLANAVLRRVSESGAEIWAAQAPQVLPGWLRGKLVAAWGKPAVLAMEAAHAAGAPLDLTPRDPAEASDLAEALSARILPTGSLRCTQAGQVSALPGYEAGRWWVQDAAAALAARVLAVQPGERVLDLCAAPGGKTLQLAAAGARVTALDVSESRMARVIENLQRSGLAAETVVADALDWQTGALFDAVLLDAPCSASGTIRRHPDLPFVKTAADLQGLFSLQGRLIDRALGLLKPGGRLVFCTCSLLPEEGERQVSAALARHPGLAVEPAALALPGVEPGWISREGGLRLRPDYWPDLGGMDGFYIARLVRKA